jgi:hypothetical protein
MSGCSDVRPERHKAAKLGETRQEGTTAMDGFDGLAQYLGSVLEECPDRGMELPFILATVAVNGSILAAKYTPSSDHDGLDATLITQHLEGPGFALPINIMIVDQKGNAARVTIGLKDGMDFH